MVGQNRLLVVIGLAFAVASCGATNSGNGFHSSDGERELVAVEGIGERSLH